MDGLHVVAVGIEQERGVTARMVESLLGRATVLTANSMLAR
jgi:hypothetical protein